MKRIKLIEEFSDSEIQKDSFYFSNENEDIKFIPSGCHLLDCVLGGGWAVGRIINLVGDKSSGKTLLAIEACANFHNEFPDCKIHYNEIESAFDKRYAESLGMPIDSIEFTEDMNTIEQLFEYLSKIIKDKKDNKNSDPELVIIDSLDALSDNAERERDIDKGSYGTNKAKQLSEMFRRINKDLSKANITPIFISQIRDKLNVMFGKKTQRAGGRALDFYASQVVWLAEIKKIKRTVNKVNRAIGVKVKAKCEKNKIGLPFRECEFPIIFGFGVDDITAGLEWLQELGKLKLVNLSKSNYKGHADNLSIKEESKFRKQLNSVIKKEWKQIEKGFLSKRRKY